MTWPMCAALLAGACQPGPDELDNAAFRDRAAAFVRELSAGDPDAACTLSLTAAQPLHVMVSMYLGGAVVGRGIAADTDLCAALRGATRGALAASGPARSQAAQARFVVDLTDHHYSLVEHDGAGVELASELVPVRVLDRAMLRRRIDEGAAYLLRVMDPELGGVHKYYHASTDTFEHRLHTVYTASTIYTLLAVHAHDRDEALRAPIERAAGFLRAMQRVAPGQPAHGAFHYSLDLGRHEREPRFVVGTAAKSIFTLIALYADTGDPTHLDAARLAADWLLTMQDADGRVSSELHLDPDGAWTVTTRASVLYTGQVLSALSRLHAVSPDDRYLEAAARTARHLAARVEREGCYLGDDYRAPNPISSSWLLLSLFDHARTGGDPTLRETVADCADELLALQIDDPDDVYRHGRWHDSLSSSGNGWLAEVLSTLYLDCPGRDPDRCARLHDPIVRLLRLLMQYTYAPENSFVVRDPAMAAGGVFWSTGERHVRTDSVCHAMNAYVFMLDHLADGVLIELPEPPLAERLGLDGRSWRLAGRDDLEADGASEEEEEP